VPITNTTEVLPRTFQHRFGDSPTAQRKFIVATTGPESQQSIINSVGVFHGSLHPEYPYLVCTDASFTETDRYHVEGTYTYEALQVGSAGFSANPLARADVWTFSTGGAQVPALVYYHGNGNGDLRPLVNSANDYIEGLTTLEAEVRATIAWNRPTFPAALAAAVTNGINDAAFLWGAKHTWQCAGISAAPNTEVVNGLEVNFWSGTTELVFRQSGWNLLLPNVGFNYLDGSTKKRATVELDGEKIPSSNPVPLAEDGSLAAASDPPIILERRVFREVPFSTYFGTPPF
jgi:hypothetical protein